MWRTTGSSGEEGGGAQRKRGRSWGGGGRTNLRATPTPHPGVGTLGSLHLLQREGPLEFMVPEATAPHAPPSPPKGPPGHVLPSCPGR